MFVHGGCHGAWCWSDWQSWFAARGRGSIALDWLSHGSSRRIDEGDWLERPITAVAEDIETAVEVAVAAYGAEPIVVGHSMGGLASLAYASTTARTLAALALLTPVVPRAFAGAPIDIEVDMTQPWGPPPPDVARQMFYSGADDIAAERYFSLLQPESPAAVWQATRWTAEVDVTQVRAPAVVVAAKNDLLVPAESVRALGRALGAHEIVLANAGHGVCIDPGWESLAAEIEAWLVEATR